MYCGECGKEINNKATTCVYCGVRTGVGEPDAVMRMLLPVGRSGFAIVAGYMGLLSFLIVPAPLAIIFGIIAVNDINNNAHKHGLGRAIFGMIMGVIFTCIYGYVFLLNNLFRH